MPTVVDSLIVTLGLDPRNFTQGQKAAAAQLTQFNQQATRQARQLEDTTRKVMNFFSNMRTSAVGLFSVVLGASGLEELTRRIVTQASSVDKLSNRYAVSAELISKFGNMVKGVGGSVEEANGFIQQLADSLLKADANIPDDFIIKLRQLQSFGISLARKDGRFDPGGTLKNIADAVARATPANRNIISNMLGIPPNVFEAMRRGNFAGRLAATPGIDKKLADSAQKLVDAFNTLQNRVTVLAASMLDDLLPPLEQMANILDAMVKTTGKDFLEKFFGIKSGGEATPDVLFDFPALLRSYGLNALGDILEGDKGKSAASTARKKAMYAPDTFADRFNAVGNVPIGLAAAANSVAATPGFRITSTTGGKHAGTAHGEGRAADIVVDPKFYDSVMAELRKQGLKVIDARTPDSRDWTGPHLHVEFANRAAMERFTRTGDTTNNSTASTHIGEINVHAPSGDAGAITDSINQGIKRNSFGTNANTGFE